MAKSPQNEKKVETAESAMVEISEAMTEPVKNSLPKFSKQNIIKAFPRHRDVFEAILEDNKKYEKMEALDLLEKFLKTPL
ncbi:MAG: hypothetical protein LBU81_00865 [Methanosarcinales archaeon]|jgi:hypothetical protein|nr:hypothetical protein [Methanosarcinales archaeon]